MSSAASYLLHVGRIIDGTGKAEMVNAAILVKDGQIQFVGPSQEVPHVEGAIIIDEPELTVMPGLIDGHNGFTGEISTIPILQGFLAHGVTTVATFQGNAAGRPSAVPLRDAIEQGQLKGCAALLVGGIVNGSHAFQRGETANGPWEVRRAVRKVIEAGADFVKAAATGAFTNVNQLCYTREELSAFVDEAHSWGVPTMVHAHTQPGLDHAIEAGTDIIVHGCFMDQSAIAKMAQRGTSYMPTLRVTSTRNLAGFEDDPSVFAKMSVAEVPHRTGVREAIAAGIRITVGGHGPGTKKVWPTSGETTSFELAELVRCGMTPLQAISSGTLRTAEVFRIDGRVGSLTPGKQADLLCFRGNPLEQIEQLQERERVALVFRKGRIEYAGGLYKRYILKEAHS